MGKILCLLSFLAVAAVTARADGEWKGTKTKSHGGYDKYSFKFEGKKAWVVVPKKAAPGNPWVWRGRWATFHIGPDKILLSKGFHIAYLDTGGMLGCDDALDMWDKFYDYMTKEHDLSTKPVLEAVSRGGLFVLRWAARHPGQVACIYGDSIVCDIKSWPLGKWKGDHDKTGMRQLGKYYGLNTKEKILAFKGNPIDDSVVKPIAKAKIPILLLVDKKDRIVPPDENSLVFAKRYSELGGGDVEIMYVPKNSKTSLKGHHFPHPDPAKAAAFMEKYGMAAAKPANLNLGL